MLFRIDATSKSFGYGRLVNDSKLNPNCKIEKVISDTNIPHLCLFAINDIKPDQELLYFYGQNSQPWYRKCVSNSF